MRVAALALLLAGGTTSVLAQADAPIVRKVDEHYNHLSSLRAQFVEHYAGLGMDKTESGTLLLKKPGRMRWTYSAPAGKVFVLDGKYAWTYSPGDAQVQRVAAKQVDDLRSPLRFLLGHTQLRKELESIEVSPEGSGFRISGLPKGMGQRLRGLVLNVSATGAIERMKIEEVDGALTEFTFTGTEENVPTRDSDFSFQPPPGVVVVDALPPI